MRTILKLSRFSKFCLLAILASIVIYGCSKDDKPGDYAINNSLTLFKLDNRNNNVDLTVNDTVSSMSGVSGKYIPVSGATGAAKGLDSIRLELFTTSNVLINSLTIKSFFKPEYHVMNTQLLIPATERGKVYKIVVSAVDKAGAIIGSKSFFGIDVVTCDPLPPCLVANQITVILETPPGTPENEDISIFGSINGWNRGDATYKFHKNPDVPNCYCVSVPFAPGIEAWQLNEIFVTRGGAWEKQAMNTNGSDFIVKYSDSDRGTIWKIKVPKWRDK